MSKEQKIQQIRDAYINGFNIPDGIINFLQLVDEYYGREAQNDMTVGEIGEFLNLFGKMRQGRCTKDMFCDEIADVIVMMIQQSVILHDDPKLGVEQVVDRVNYKLNRLQKRILDNVI
jgi:NTP pyrophosphatase (non-canonical NTP hydrolase)